MAFNYLSVQIRPSRTLLILALLIHLFALSVIFLIQLEIILKIGLLLIIVFHGFYCWRIIRLKNDQSIMALFYNKGSWWGVNRQGDRDELLLQSAYYSRFLIILYFKSLSGGKRRIILCRDAIDDKIFNRLMVVLRYDNCLL